MKNVQINKVKLLEFKGRVGLFDEVVVRVVTGETVATAGKGLQYVLVMTISSTAISL